MHMTTQESFGQTIDKLLAQAMEEHKTFSLQISINPMEAPKITAVSKQSAHKPRASYESEIDEIFMIGQSAQ